MRIVVDLQAAQSPRTRHRGIGRYSMALAKAMLRARGPHDIVIALNGMFAETIAPIREAFDGLVAPQDIRVWHASAPPRALAAGPAGYVEAARRIRQAFLESLQPDFVHLASLFETSSYAVTAVPERPAPFRTAVTLYDLIPHINPEVYLATPQAAADYADKLEHLRRADLWLAISASSRREGIERLALPADRVVEISSAADPHFTAEPVSRVRTIELRAKYALAHPYALYTGGIDPRKNIDGLIRAWARVPWATRQQHHLAIVCAMDDAARANLERTIVQAGLSAHEVRLIGFVPDEDLVDLYRMCKLFVFPSKHEGFGLPALEAMACGAPVIGGRNSSIPEVIGRDDALFDASSEESIAASLVRCLDDDAFRLELARDGLKRAQLFSWERSAQLALDAMQAAAREPLPVSRPASSGSARPRLALVSPMPPQRSGIADATAELLPHLAQHYDIELVVDQPQLDEQAAAGVKAVRDAAWFAEHGAQYERIVYQFGNSDYHTYMLPLLARHPGVVVLHDFFLGGLVSHAEHHHPERFANAWNRALYDSHGWQAVADRYRTPKVAEIIFRYPANFGIARQATGVVVHSEYALRLARAWYRPEASRAWALVPLPRTPAQPGDRAAARARLGIAPGEFVACSFGLLGPTKANHRLLRAWRASPLAAHEQSRLVFVGEPQRSAYGRAFAAELAVHPGNVSVTGWVDNTAYADWLAAADVAVQLRTQSRGETSAAVLDCMNHGLATIANREGSMADLDPQAVWLLPQEFADSELVDALGALWRDPARREALGARSRALVHGTHTLQACAAKYRDAIESFHGHAAPRERLLDAVGAALGPAIDANLACAVAAAIALNETEIPPAHQLLLDVTPWAREGEDAPHDAPGLLAGLVESAARGWRTEPVYRRADGTWHYARRFTLSLLRCPPVLTDEPAEMRPGDLWATVGAASREVPARVTELALQSIVLPAGGDAGAIWSMLRATDAQPVQRQWFVDISELVRRDWHSGIQRVVKNYLTELLARPPEGTSVIPVCATQSQPGYFCAERFTRQLAGIEGGRVVGEAIQPRAGDLFFGLDLQPHVVPAQHDYFETLRRSGVRTGFMVYDLLPVQLPACFSPGAAENHARWLREVAHADFAICISQAVADALAGWIAQSVAPDMPRITTVHLGADLAHALPTTGIAPEARGELERIRRAPAFLMVGTLEPRKAQAQVLAAFERLWARGVDASLVVAGRRGWMVDELAATLQSHPQRGNHLFWFEQPSDEFLEQLYGASAALIAASLGEGFGLPLVEAAQRSLALIARDIPVFREVAGEHAFYFTDDEPEALAATIEQWLQLRREGREPRPQGMRWSTWRESADRLRDTLLEFAAPGGSGGPGQPGM